MLKSTLQGLRMQLPYDQKDVVCMAESVERGLIAFGSRGHLSFIDSRMPSHAGTNGVIVLGGLREDRTRAP